jgi:nitroreductase
MELSKVIKDRRSIRRYRKDPIADTVILECIEAARLAPSWANTQASRYVVIKDQAIKESLAETLQGSNPAHQAVIDAPCVVCLVSQRNLSGFKKGEATTDKGDWFMYDAGVAMEHLVLTAWSLGLGTVHVGLFDAKKADEILGVPEGFSIVSMTPLGYFEDTPDPRPRKALEDILYLDKFGRSFSA